MSEDTKNTKQRVRLEKDGEDFRTRTSFEAEREQLENNVINESLEKVGVKAAKRAGDKHATVVGSTNKAQAIKKIYAQLVQDQGGFDNLSYMECELLRRYATLAVIGASFDQQVAIEGQLSKQDLDALILVTRTESQIAKTIGLERKQKDISGDLKSYLKQISRSSKKADHEGYTYEN